MQDVFGTPVYIPEAHDQSCIVFVEALRRDFITRQIPMVLSAEQAQCVVTTTREDSEAYLKDGKDVVQIVPPGHDHDSFSDLADEHGVHFTTIKFGNPNT